MVSTMISSRAITPRAALGIAALGIALGPFMVGTAVAVTVGQEFVRADHINLRVVIAGLAAAILWCAVAQWSSIPVSSSMPFSAA
ncbi:MAG: inorganic phosphate transporter [Anaerolineae bacterium]